MAMSSPFLLLNNSNMIPQQKFITENTFPTFNSNLLFTLPKNKSPEQLIVDQKQVSMKMQLMEEKLRNLESKSSMLDSINKNMMMKNSSTGLTGLNEPEVMNSEAMKILNEIKEEINDKLGKRFYIIYYYIFSI
jgi:hypothetical protein